MSRFNTGNPLGSGSPLDLDDNAKNMDLAVNSDAPNWADRFGERRFTMSEQDRRFRADQAERAAEFDVDQAAREQEFDADQSSREQEFRTFIASSGYQFAGDYAAGIEITQYNQLVRDENGEFWRVSGQVDLPYVTTGAGLPEGDALVPAGDAVLRQDIEIRRAKEDVNVLDFGVTGRGAEGVDDTDAFQAAVDYAVSAGKSVFIPSSESFYLTSKEILVEGAENIEIRAAKGAVFKSTGQHTGYPIYPQKPRIPFGQAFFVLEGCKNTDFIGGKFDGSAGAHGAGIKSSLLAGLGVMIRNGEGCRIINSDFFSIGDNSHGWNDGVNANPKRSIGGFITQSKNCGIYDCKAKLCGYEGFSSRIAVDGINFIGNSQDDDEGPATHMLQPTNDYGGVLPLPEHDYARNIKIINNTGTGKNSDITLHGENVIVMGNTLTNVLNSPIDVRAYSKSVTIIGNTIVAEPHLRGEAAIWLLGGIPDCFVDGNVIVNFDKEYEISLTSATHFMGNNILRDVGDANITSVRLGQAAGTNSPGDDNTSVGRHAGSMIAGAQNTSYGAYTLKGSTGTSNVGIGFRAGLNSSGNEKCQIGFEAGQNSTGDGGIAIGRRAGRGSDLTDAIAIGFEAAVGATSFTRWTAIGRRVIPTASDQFKIGHTQHIEISQLTTPGQPGPPSATELRIYAVSVGGKVTLRAKFPSGQTVDIASDPG